MSFQFIPTGMRIAKKAPLHSKLPSLWKTNCNEAPTNIRSQVQNWFPQMKLYPGPLESLLGVPSHACASVLSSGAEVSATVKFAVQFHKIPTCKARTAREGEGAGRTKTVKRVNTAEGQERAGYATGIVFHRRCRCHKCGKYIRHLASSSAQLGDRLAPSSPNSNSRTSDFGRYTPDTTERGATHGNTTRCVTFLAALQRGRRPVTRSKIDSSLPTC